MSTTKTHFATVNEVFRFRMACGRVQDTVGRRSDWAVDWHRVTCRWCCRRGGEIGAARLAELDRQASTDAIGSALRIGADGNSLVVSFSAGEARG